MLLTANSQPPVVYATLYETAEKAQASLDGAWYFKSTEPGVLFVGGWCLSLWARIAGPPYERIKPRVYDLLDYHRYSIDLSPKQQEIAARWANGDFHTDGIGLLQISGKLQEPQLTTATQRNFA